MAKTTQVSSTGRYRTARKRATVALRADGRRRAAERTARSASRGQEPGVRTDGDVPWLVVVGASHNNLKNITVEIPLQRFVCVTGVSGSGKSSLVNDILREALARDLNGAIEVRPGEHDRIDGLEHLDKIIDIDQSAIGRTPRSNPATYIKVFDEIRALYAKLPDSRVRGYRPGRFSFNVKTGAEGGGRCEACEGNGANRMEMDFLADIWVACPVCGGRRFNRETLQVLFRGKSIADVLEMDVQQALEHFENVPKIAAMLRTLHEVGLDYLKLGQSSTTLSGGEAQRIKLARELVKRSTGRTLYVLDEPTTGLHFADIKRLLAVLHGFVDAGNTVVVIEHNLDVVKTADWVIDLGPEGGDAGGEVVAQGTPEEVARSQTSYTGEVLAEVLHGRASRDDTRAAGFSPRERAKTGDDRSPTDRSRRLKSAAQEWRREVITVVGAKQHNLKDITVEIPRGKTTVCCGPSGSGKSSLAIDTIYTEGQRRYVESLSAYARQFLSRLQPPRVDHVYGLSPAICIEQKTTSKSPRSTVGTVTEIYDYMRVLWARVGQPHCPKCRVPIGTQASDEIVEKVLALGEGRKVLLLAPVEPTGQETYEQLFRRERANGYARVRIDGEVYALDEEIEIDRRRRHAVELVVDRVIVRRAQAGRLADSVEQALSVGDGVMIAQVVEDGEAGRDRNGEHRFSQHHSCDRCGTSYEPLTPHHFSFNSRMGWCSACEGLGVQQGATPAAVVIHPTRSIGNGAIAGWGSLRPGSRFHAIASALADHFGFDLDTPWSELTEAQRLAFLHGCGDDWIEVRPTAETPPQVAGDLLHLRFRWHGFFPAIHRATRSSWQYRKRLEELVTEVPCEACAGGRLRPDAAAVRLAGSTIHEICLRPLGQALRWFEHLKLSARDRKVAGELLHEITARLRFLVEVGLDYVSLHRTTATLSGGEAQRIQLASQIGTGLTGVLYVLDEPTIGLHPRDNGRLIRALRRLRDLGNTLIVVEHDREVIDSADHVLDFGPGAGAFGGEITAAAAPGRIRRDRASLTGKFLSGRESIPVPSNRRPTPAKPRPDLEEIDDAAEPVRETAEQAWLVVHGAREHNLKEIDAAFPLGRFTCVTGVSGSGKSTLVSSILYNALAARIHRARLVPGGHQRITGVERVDKVINVDQSPIGNSPTSNPATYTGVFDVLRDLYAKLPVSRVRGYTPNRFSFNRPGGRCEVCEGMGQRCIEMHFLPDVWVECENCKGKRYVAETLDVQYRGKSIADVLAMRIAEALLLFENVPKVRRMMQTLDDVGLGYLQLGQSAPTLSGGEAQRVKLAAELGRPSTGKTLYLLDEPTTGLHFDDLRKLLAVLHRLVDLGNTCICIEHNLDVIKTADWVIDLGPEAGDAGGTIVAEGPPEAIAATPESHTGAALAPVLAAGPSEPRAVFDVHHQQVAEKALASPIRIEDDIKMPWERDGRAWHTVGHLDHQGAPVEWDPQLLVWVVETLESLGDFAPTDWNHRSRIELKVAGNQPWFCHVLTGSKDLLDVAIRVKHGTFALAALRDRLGIKPLDERPDLPIYGRWNRVRLRTPQAGWQEVRLYLRDFKDVDKPSFRSFFKTAVASYLGQIQTVQADPQRAKPWKTDGQQWHLSQRSIRKRHLLRWQPALLVSMLGRLKSIQPDLVVRWDQQTAVQFAVPGEDRPAGKIVTNMPRGLRLELRGPKNVCTPTEVDRLGEDVEIKHYGSEDWISFWVRSLDQHDARQLREVWRRCRPGSGKDIPPLAGGREGGRSRPGGRDERLRSA